MFGMINFHLTQFLTGHVCLGQYLFKFKRINIPVCQDCQAPIDNADHAFFLCDHWNSKRRELEVAIKTEFCPETVIRKMLESIHNWRKVSNFVDHVLSVKEEEERMRQRQIIIEV